MREWPGALTPGPSLLVRHRALSPGGLRRSGSGHAGAGRGRSAPSPAPTLLHPRCAMRNPALYTPASTSVSRRQPSAEPGVSLRTSTAPLLLPAHRHPACHARHSTRPAASGPASPAAPPPSSVSSLPIRVKREKLHIRAKREKLYIRVKGEAPYPSQREKLYIRVKAETPIRVKREKLHVRVNRHLHPAVGAQERPRRCTQPPRRGGGRYPSVCRYRSGPPPVPEFAGAGGGPDPKSLDTRAGASRL